jgi:hypothetical protein
MSSNRPDIELALDVRSYERVVVLSDPQSTFTYPEHWHRPMRGTDIGRIDAETVVIVDRVEVYRKTVSQVGAGHPRLIAFAPANVEQEKSMRRTLRSVYPWAELWEIHTSFGKILVTKDARGPEYDRDSVVDMRAPAAA